MIPPVRPERLHDGDVVAVVSPSTAQLWRYPDRASRARRAVESLGLRVQVMPNAAGRPGPLGSLPVGARLDDLHAAFADPAVSAVLCAIGGHGASDLLDGLDVDLVAAHPKVFLGYSDATVLHTALRERTGLVTFYSPSLLMELGEFPQPHAETLDGLRRAVMSDVPVGTVPVPDWMITGSSDWDTATVRPREPAPPPRVLRPGNAIGVLTGGCLPVLARLVGTPWQPTTRDRVLLLETPQAPYSVGEALSDLRQLRLAGFLDGVVAVVVGRTWNAATADALDTVLDTVVPAGLPLLTGLPVGHSSPFVTVPLGVDAEVRDGTLTITSPATRPVRT